MALRVLDEREPMSLLPAARLATAVLATTLAVTLTAAGGSTGAAAPAPEATAAADDVRASTAGRAPERAPLLPNMVPLRATDIYVTGSGSSRTIRFETSLANVGRGPMEVRPNPSRPCPSGKRGASQIIYQDVDGSGFFKRDVDTDVKRRATGCMVFHASHNHWHFEASSFYSLRAVDGRARKASAYRKTSFCLRDSERVPEHLGTFHQPLHYGACSRDRPMGVNIGWADVYQSFLDGQSLPLGRRSKVPDGRYCLGIKVDPKDVLREADERDNTSWRALRIRGTSVTALPHRVCD